MQGQSLRPFPNCLKRWIMCTPDNQEHNLSDMHNWALPENIIINLCVSHGAAINQKKCTPTLPLSPSGSSAPSFTALKRCNNRRVRELCWGVFTPAAWSAGRRGSFQTRLTSPMPGGRSPSLAGMSCVHASLMRVSPYVLLWTELYSVLHASEWQFDLHLYFVSFPFRNVCQTSCQSIFCQRWQLTGFYLKDNMVALWWEFWRGNWVIRSYKLWLR